MLCEGRNCWKYARAGRVAFLIDAAEYFDRLVDSLERARRSILVVGWDVHSRVRLRRGRSEAEDVRLLPLLERLVGREPQLDVRILCWDFAMIYAMERELLPTLRFAWKTPERIRFELDGNHPLGASHHQKIVVVDDELAFVGGLDLTMRRWDTSDHEARDARRVDPGGHPYQPFHDVQMAVSGAVAARLGDLVRERWRRATGERLASPPSTEGDPWPPALAPELEDVDVAIARTDPEYREHPEVREIERLYRDAIAAAEREIYIENQYFTAGVIGTELEYALQRENGPELLVVTSRSPSGWLEEAGIGRLRSKLVSKLREADRDGRFSIRYPHRAGLGERWVKVHSKIAIFDDRLVTVGSANLANRSMGLDTECNLALEARRPEERRALRRLRLRLLAEHVGSRPEEVADRVERTGSLVEAARVLGSDERRLEELPIEQAGWLEPFLPEPDVLDPERPVDPRTLGSEFLAAEEVDADRKRFPWTLSIALGVVVLLAVAWRYGPAAASVDADRLTALIEAYRQSPAAIPLTVATYVVCGLAMVPVTILIVATASVFGPIHGALHAMIGSLCSAVVTFAIGRLAGRRGARRIAGSRVDRISVFLERRGALSMAAIRLVPIAPFGLVNLVAGAAGVRWRPFLVGTVLGMAPGITALSLLGDRAAKAARDPNWATVATVVLLAAALIALERYVSRRVRGSSGSATQG